MVGSFFDRPDITRVLFHPRIDPSPDEDDARRKTVRFNVAEGVTLGGRLYPAAQDAPAILYFHGNGEIASDYDDWAPFYTRLGLTLLVVDYRGYGISTGTPRASTLLEDAVSVFQQTPALLAGQGLAPARLLVMGRSLGSAAALMVAAAASSEKPAVSGLIIESGFANSLALVERLSGVPAIGADESRDGFGALGHIKSVTVPTLIIHGEEDYLIPIREGRALFEAAGAADKRWLAIPKAGHNDLMMVGVDRYFPAVAALAQAA